MDKEITKYQNNFNEKIENLYMLHYITKKYDHIIGNIGNQRGTWTLFEPSKFIYAYFAFNSFYNFDWEKSIKEKILLSFETENIGKKESITCPECAHIFEKEKKITEGQKYKAMIDFIFDRAIEPEKQFIEIILEKCGRKEKIIEDIEGITPDDYIEDYEREGFKKEFFKLLETGIIKKKPLRDVIIRFIFLVRNNIFHGSKDTIQMSENCQRRRLNIYSNIIIAINELLFKVLEEETEFKPKRNYYLPQLAF